MDLSAIEDGIITISRSGTSLASSFEKVKVTEDNEGMVSPVPTPKVKPVKDTAIENVTGIDDKDAKGHTATAVTIPSATQTLPKTETGVKLTPCGNCGKECSTSCGNCRKEYYCSVICQKARRPKHKHICFPAKDEMVSGVRARGNDSASFWVATRDIEQGETIFTDYPLIILPGEDEYVPGQEVCLGCHDILKNFSIVTDTRKCRHCQWPLCTQYCSGVSKYI